MVYFCIMYFIVVVVPCTFTQASSTIDLHDDEINGVSA